MMPPLPASVAVARRASRDPAVDYAGLREEGLRLAQHWSGAHWTDYGEHDPGVTLLELLCYALTELGYRTGFPVEDLIAAPAGEGGAADLLHRPGLLFGSEPVTANDFRKLLIDRVPDLADAWLEPRSPGLLDLRLYRRPRLPGLVAEPDPQAEAALLRRARRAFQRHRSLCEDLASAALLRPRPVRVSASVAVEPRTDAEEVMAEILYRLGAFLAPEPRRGSLESRRGVAEAELTEGVALANGLIADSELGPRRRTIAAADLERHISAVPGVLGVHDLVLGPAPATLADDECFALDAGLGGPGMPIAVTVDGFGVDVDPAEVRRRLERKWMEHRRTFRTAGELARVFPVPAGRPRDIASHEPLAAHLPAIYGVGRDGVALGLGPARAAQAEQLLGYLSIFERLILDYLDRLSGLRSILASEALDKAALRRPLAEALPALAPLLIAGGPDSDTLLGREALSGRQQDRLLDFLLALYGEVRGELIPSGRGAAGERQRRQVKRRILAEIVPAGRRRGRGLDYGGSPGRRRAPGLEERALVLIGHHEERRRRRPRLRVLEHVLMRSRGTDDAHPEAIEPLAVSVVVHPGQPDPADASWRRQAIDMIRAETPAHLEVHVHFVDRAGWVTFKRLYRLWRGALRGGYEEAADLLSRDIRRFLSDHPEGMRNG